MYVARIVATLALHVQAGSKTAVHTSSTEIARDGGGWLWLHATKNHAPALDTPNNDVRTEQGDQTTGNHPESAWCDRRESP